MSAAEILDVLLEASLRATIVTGLVAVALVAFRVKSPAIRHALWTTALVTMLALPALSAWLPTIPLPLRLPPASTPFLTSAQTTPTEAPVVVSRPGTVTPAPPADATALDVTTSTATSRPAQTPSPAVPSAWEPVVLLGWLMIAIVLLLREVAGWRLAGQLAAQSVPTTTDDGTYESGRVHTPLVTGVWSPRVLVPRSWPEWGADVRGMALAHERAHVTRRDPLVACLARVNRAVFWFHPLAWWLERHLARAAEQACDEIAAREVNDSRLYAALLLEMANRLRHHGHRVAWQGIGIVSGRRLEDRIDRILRGPAPTPSRLKKAVLASAVVLLITAAVACGTAAAPLAEDPELANELTTRAKRMSDFHAAMAMTVVQVAELERVVAANPDDLDSTHQLLDWYRQKGQKAMGWNEMVAARRPHLLRMIERHPDSELASWPFARHLDPAGYDQARALWLAEIENPDVTVRILGRAAAFFEISEKPMAEQILLRAQSLDPNGPTPQIVNGAYYSPWSAWLGRLYAKAIVGSDDETLGNVVKSVSQSAAAGPFAAHARKVLSETTDPLILFGAGQYLLRNTPADIKLDFDHRALGRSYLEMALQFDSSLDAARQVLSQPAHEAAYQRMLQELGKPAAALDDAAIDELSDDIKLRYSPDLLWLGYRRAMSAYLQTDDAAVEAALGGFKRRAELLLQLAGTAPSSPAKVRLASAAHIALGTYAMRQEDRREAVRQLALAVPVGTVPAGVWDSSYHTSYSSSMALELTHELLSAGERESVAAYYDAMAKFIDEPRVYADAARAIREGRMPAAYQRYLARPS